MKNILLISLILVLGGCNLESEAEAISSNFDGERIWVFGQFNVPAEDDDLESYYYYGSVSQDLYKSIANSTIKIGFIHLQDIVYWGDDDLFHTYKDKENTGDMIFRIEHIVRIKQIENLPITGKGYEQFDEPEADKTSTNVTES